MKNCLIKKCPSYTPFFTMFILINIILLLYFYILRKTNMIKHGIFDKNGQDLFLCEITLFYVRNLTTSRKFATSKLYSDF